MMAQKKKYTEIRAMLVPSSLLATVYRLEKAF
jgi:hypothetical protein